MKFRTLGAVAAALALAATLTACGNQEEEASKAISDSMVKNGDETFQVTRDQADCVGDGFVDKIGVDQLKEYGVITEDLKTDGGIDSVKMSKDDAGSAADVMLDCADVKKVFTDAMGDQVPEEVQSCIDEKLNDEVLHDFLVAVFQDDQSGGQEQLMTALQECVSA